MYVVTFYSFKGGVGRTMAMVNVAADLAGRGCRVLMVDFDLEAPGLASYEAFGCAANQPGLVDYVHEYVTLGAAPDVSRYLTACDVPGLPAGKIAVMSAGRRDAEYAARLAALDWQALYRDHDGYIMFEDMRQQISEIEPKFDYVLIDSRTGHTDVGGICTRQLPDEVVLMFFPNGQNVEGMRAVVGGIRAEAGPARRARLLFCPSNVPDLDDEDGILESRMKVARETLGFREPASVIKHYDSLSMLEEPIFVLQRARTRLAAEYKALSIAVAGGNIADRVGALAQINDITRQTRPPFAREDGELVEGASEDDTPDKVLERLQAICDAHPEDAEVASALAGVYLDTGEFEAAAKVLGVSVAHGPDPLRARLERATAYAASGSAADAQADLEAIIRAPQVDGHVFTSALRRLRRTKIDWVAEVERSHALQMLVPGDKLAVTRILMSAPSAANLAYAIATDARRKAVRAGQRTEAITTQALALIAAGRFAEAMTVIDPDRSRVLRSNNVTAVFNYAMAEWGANGSPSLDILNAIVELDSTPNGVGGANYHQCLSLVYREMNDVPTASARLKLAFEEVFRIPEVFSCWRYSYVDAGEMQGDLEEQRRYVEESVGRPLFLTRGMRD